MKMKKYSANIPSATFYIRVPISLIEEFEEWRAEKGYEKSYMVTQAFRYYIDNVLNKNQAASDIAAQNPGTDTA